MHKSLKEIVEAVDNPALEESWIKRKGEELSSVSTKREEGEVKSIFIHFLGEKFTFVHTHPDIDPRQKNPSVGDYINFLMERDEKTMIISQTDPYSGKLIGSFIVRKTRDTPSLDKGCLLVNLFDMLLNIITFRKYRGHGLIMNLINAKNNLSEDQNDVIALKDFMLKYGLRSKYFPAEKHYQ